MGNSRPEPAVRSLALFRGPNGDPALDAQLLAGGDLRVLSIRRDDVWRYSDIDTVGWWTWHTVSRVDLPRLAGEGGDVLATVRAAVAPEADGESAMLQRFEAWLDELGVPYTKDSYDEREL